MDRLVETRKSFGRVGIQSKPTVTQEELDKIVSQGWIDAKKHKMESHLKRPSSSNVKKAHIKSQNTIMEEQALSSIVSKAWTTVELKK